MKNISDLQIGKAGEYLVCADLILNDIIAFPSEQGLPFDVVADIGGKLYRVQVKTTRGPKSIPQRANPIPAYIFHIGINGKGSRRKKYASEHVDFFALVALDSRQVAYIPNGEISTTMNFRVPSLRGSYHDEKAVQLKASVLELKAKGLMCQQIADSLGLSLKNTYRYSADVSIEQKGTNAGVYFDQFTLESCLKKLIG
jgi:hypothetical protein